MSTCLTHTEEYIKMFYLKIGISTPQELQFRTISNYLGISTFYWPEQSQALFTGNKGFILLNENLSPQQQWQDFCHELCHVLLHTGHQGNMAPLFREYQEKKANNFMYHACMPTFMLDALQVRNYMPITIRRLQQLFGVEYDFALKRITQYLMNKMLLDWNGRHTGAMKE